MAEDTGTLLIVEDDLDIAEMLNTYFRSQGYEVLTVNWGEDGVRMCQTTPPDLVILDIRLPDIDGYEVARRLRGNRRTSQIPIIFLTDRRERGDRLKGLELRADDYITKPFDVQELRLRVRNVLQRNRQSPLTNPITNLPEGQLVDERLEGCLGRADWTILSVLLDHLDGFREKYGFVAADDAIRGVALMLADALREAGGPNAFLGQLSPVHFLLVTAPDRSVELRNAVHKRLDQSLSYFYSDQDRQKPNENERRLAVRIQQLVPADPPVRDLGALKSQISPQLK